MKKRILFSLFFVVTPLEVLSDTSWLQGQAANISTSNIVIAQAVTGGIIDIEGTGAICSDGDNTNHWTFGYRDSDKKIYTCDNASGSYNWNEFTSSGGSSWNNLNLSDTSSFNPQCEYVANNIRVGYVSPSELGYVRNGISWPTTATWYRISSGSKGSTVYAQDNYNNMSGPSSFATVSILERCN